MIFVAFLCIIVSIYYISTLFTDSSRAPQSYARLYDIVDYMEKGHKVLLRDSNKHFSIYGKKEHNKIFYSFELADSVYDVINMNTPIT